MSEYKLIDHDDSWRIYKGYTDDYMIFYHDRIPVSIEEQKELHVDSYPVIRLINATEEMYKKVMMTDRKHMISKFRELPSV